jgi:hypothetical protein
MTVTLIGGQSQGGKIAVSGQQSALNDGIREKKCQTPFPCQRSTWRRRQPTSRGHGQASPTSRAPPPAGFDASDGDVALIASDVIPDSAFPIPHSAFAWGREAPLGWRLLSGRSHYAQAACGRRPEGFALTPHKRPGPSVLPEPPRLLGSRRLLRALWYYCVMWPGMILQHQLSDRVKSEHGRRAASPRRRAGLRVLPSPGQSRDAGCSP